MTNELPTLFRHFRRAILRHGIGKTWTEACSWCKGYPEEIAGSACYCSRRVRFRRWLRGIS